jgi:hypothetical protein
MNNSIPPHPIKASKSKIEKEKLLTTQDQNSQDPQS